jgi:transcriptional regulator with XRE-family HTH domain
MNKHDGSTLDSLFEELGELEEVNARAAKKILVIETERRMKKLGLTTTALAKRMGTSRNQIHRILDKEDAGITLKVLFRLAGALGVPLQLGFGSPGLRARQPRRAAKGRQARQTELRKRRRVAGVGDGRSDTGPGGQGRREPGGGAVARRVDPAPSGAAGRWSPRCS